MLGSFTLLLAAVFGWAAYAKWQDGATFRGALDRLLPKTAAQLVSRLMPAAELLVCAALLCASNAFRPLAAGTCLAMLLGFTAALWVMHLRHMPACGCFGEASDEHSHLNGIARNVLLGCCAFATLRWPAQANPFAEGPANLAAHLTIAAGMACTWSLLNGLIGFYRATTQGGQRA